jgi:hypothetical protein
VGCCGKEKKKKENGPWGSWAETERGGGKGLERFCFFSFSFSNLLFQTFQTLNTQNFSRLKSL